MVNNIDNDTSSMTSTFKNNQPKTHIQKIEMNVSLKKQSEENLSAEEAKTMADSMNKFLNSTDSHLKFVFHDELSEYYVTIVDTATDEVIREIPAKKLMDIHAAMKEFVGLIVDTKI